MRLPLFVLATLSCGDDSASPAGPGVPVAAAVVGGDGQQAVVGGTLAGRPTVRVVDRNGSPVSGAAVVWEVAAGGGEVSPASGATTSDGTHSTTWRLGAGAGEQRLRARVQNLAPAAFTAIASPGPASKIQLSKEVVVLVLDQGLDETNVQASVLDQFDNPRGDPVEWSVPDGTVAEVDQTGRVRAVGPGFSSVQARMGSLVGGASLTVENPVPVLSATVPTSVVVGSPGLTMILTGSGFVPGTVVLWNESPRAATFVARNRIEMYVPPEDLAVPGEASIRLANAAPGGGSTAAVSFVVGAGVGAVASVHLDTDSISLPEGVSTSSSPRFATPRGRSSRAWGFSGTRRREASSSSVRSAWPRASAPAAR